MIRPDEMRRDLTRQDKIKVRWFDQECLIWKPPYEGTIEQHGERCCVLPRDSAIQGPWVASMVPYLSMVFDCIQDAKVYSVSIVKSSQCGISVGCQVIVGYYIEQHPSPIFMILADQETSEFLNEQRYQPMFEGNEAYRSIMNPDAWTKSRKGFLNGAYLEMGWASSVSKMGTRSMRIAICDECDKPGYSILSREAGALKLAENRLKTFLKLGAKFIMLSTPTDEFGNITKATEAAEVVFDWHVPCPHCGQYQPLNWWQNPSKNHWFPEGLYRDEQGVNHPLGHVAWEGGTSATTDQIRLTTRYICGECGGEWTEKNRERAIKEGKKVSRNISTGQERHVGICITELVSLFVPMEYMVSEWVRIFRTEDRRERDKELQDFVNSRLAEPWVQVIVASSELNLSRAKTYLPPQTVPEEAVALTCGIDCQKYGFWFVVRAWAPDYSSWLIDYGYLKTWDDVEILLDSSYNKVESSQPVKIWRAGIDSGGTDDDEGTTMTEQCYFWVRAHNTGRHYRLWATKGASSDIAGAVAKYGETRDRTPSGKPLRGGLQLVLLDTNKLKEIVFERFNSAVNGDSFQPAYLHSAVGNDYARQITAEEKRRDQKGKITWVVLRRNNHLLDCECQAAALADPTWPGGGVNILSRGQRVVPRQTPGRPGTDSRLTGRLQGRVINPALR